MTEVGLLEDEPIVTRVDVQGPLEQRAGYYEPCGGWSDGHDAVAERMIAALAEGDVIMVIDSPGGAAAGLQEAVRRVVHAKEELGRHVIAYADEMIGSAAYWWAACVADEIYGPPSMIVGSIGARAAHGSMAGALAKEGVEVTFFAWPGEGKVAFAPELPLSDLGRQRGNRDVAMAGEAFAAAVGPRRGLSRDEIVELDADALHGAMALEARLVDGIASLEDVMEYALALAAHEPGENDDMKTKGPTKPGIASATRSEDPKDPDKTKAEGDGDGDPKKDPPPSDKMECTGCGMANEKNAKYCDQCGAPMGDTAAAEGDEPDGDEPPKKDPEEGRAAGDTPDEDERSEPAPPDERRATAAHAGSLAALVGLRANASHPAIKSAVISLASLAKAAMGLTGTKSPGEAEGALKSLADDAAEVANLRTEVKAGKKREARREKMDLLLKLAAKNLPGYPRGELLVDREVQGKIVTGPAPMYDEMPLSTLRGFVNGKLTSSASGPASVTQRSPFEPDPNRARVGAENALVEADLSTPFIQDLASRSSASAEQLAKTARALEAQGVRS